MEVREMPEKMPTGSGAAAEARFDDLVELIEAARVRVWRAVNAELVQLYWDIGRYLSERTAQSKWGDKVVDGAAEFLRRTRPDFQGFTRRTLFRMREFYDTYRGDEIVSPLVTQITWTNHLVIMQRSKTLEERRFYIEKCISEHYSKRQLERQFDVSFFERCQLGKVADASAAVTPPVRSVVRDLYAMEFLDLPERPIEGNIRDALVAQMRDFILELGQDFTFKGKEFPVRVGKSDFSIDLLFYHRVLRCFFAFELKTHKFHPKDLGQLDFYLEALDRDVKKPDENPSVGVVLCTDKDDTVVEYALSRSLSPAMVATYELALPNKQILQERLRQITALTMEAAQISELPDDEEEEP